METAIIYTNLLNLYKLLYLISHTIHFSNNNHFLYFLPRTKKANFEPILSQKKAFRYVFRYGVSKCSS